VLKRTDDVSEAASFPLGARRKKYLVDRFDALAAGRDAYIRARSYYFDEDLKYLRFLIPEGASLLVVGCGTGHLLRALKPGRGVGIDISARMVEKARQSSPEYEFHVGDAENISELVGSLAGPFDYVLLPDTMGFLNDCQATLEQFHPLMNRDSRLILSYYSHIWEPALKLGEMLGAKSRQPDPNFIGAQDFVNLLELTEFDIVRREWRLLSPFRLFGLGTLLNRYLCPLPGVRNLSLRHYVVARSLQHAAHDRALSCTVLVPCRNEAGNIENAVTRLPQFCDDLEIVFVEGNSSDGTYEECLRVQEAYSDRRDIKVFKQPGRGKGDAVRKGFDEARGDVLIILDADLTVPPEDIQKFYKAIASGKAEFVNGTRLLYPMEDGAMRVLNYWANRFFARLFSYFLNSRYTDTLCGTKVLRKHHYLQVMAGRDYFGDFDPFGDFDLLFGASKLSLKVVEVPIRYANRQYGQTQISRFRDGWKLLKMVAFAYRKMKAL
jgi:SAM-dependent methyltransferase